MAKRNSWLDVLKVVKLFNKEIFFVVEFEILIEGILFVKGYINIVTHLPRKDITTHNFATLVFAHRHSLIGKDETVEFLIKWESEE